MRNARCDFLLDKSLLEAAKTAARKERKSLTAWIIEVIVEALLYKGYIIPEVEE